MNSSQIDALNRAINQFSEEEKILILPNRFAYIFSKAWLYMKLGPEKYRKTDAFNQPPSDLDKEDLEIIANGCFFQCFFDPHVLISLFFSFFIVN